MIKLPKADDHGNYWMSKDHKLGAAIFPHKEIVGVKGKDDGEVRATGKWTVLLPDGRGFLEYKDGERMMFDGLEAACVALESVLSR